MDLTVLKYGAVSVALVGAAVLAFYEKEGWGWLIFAAVLVAG